MFIGQFKARYFEWINTLGVVLQFFVVSRVIKYLGLRVALVLMPIASLSGYSVALAIPSIMALFGARVVESSLDLFALEHETRQALWLVTSRDAKYKKQKQVIDTFVVRAGGRGFRRCRLARRPRGLRALDPSSRSQSGALARLARLRAAPREEVCDAIGRACDHSNPLMRRALATALCVGLVATGATSHADTPSPKRPLPDYDGRPDPAPTPGQDALWKFRASFSSPYLVSEYLLRRPLGALITLAERDNWATTLLDIFTFGPDHKAGIVPTAFFDFGLRPSVGIYTFWDDALFRGHDLRAHVSYFGSDWFSAAASERVHVGKKSIVSIDFGFLRRPDSVYAGEGPRTLQSAQSRYLGERFDVAPAFDTHLTKRLTYHAKVGVRAESFHDSQFDQEPSVGQSAAAGTFALPTDYARGFTSVYERSELTFDTRREPSNAKSGVRLDAYVEHDTNFRLADPVSWIKYGATAGGYIDVWHARVLSLTATTEFADPLRGNAIPFTEEVVWGGSEPMSGFLPGRLHGRSAAAATLEYAWPIWVWLDGTLRASLRQRVRTPGLRDFAPGLLRLSSGIGVQSNGSPDHRFEILAGFATETFEQGGKVDSFRLVLGGTNGF